VSPGHGVVLVACARCIKTSSSLLRTHCARMFNVCLREAERKHRKAHRRCTCPGVDSACRGVIKGEEQARVFQHWLGACPRLWGLG
jgi:hypothetical protein